MIISNIDCEKAISPEKQKEAMIEMGKLFLKQPKHEKDSNSRLGEDATDKEVAENE